MYNNVYRIMFDKRFESEDDPLFLKLKALNGERSRLAQSFEYNYSDFIPILRPFLRGYLKICKDIKERRLQLFKNYFVDERKIMFDRRFESEDDPLFLKLKALNGERSRLAQSFEYNYGDFIPILRPILRGYLKICKDIKERRLQLFKNYFVDERKVMFDRRFDSEDDPLFLKLKALNGESSRLAQSFEYNYGDFIPILRPFLRGYLKICKDIKERRLQLFKNYFVDERKFESEDDPLFLKLKALNGERSRLAQSFEYNYGDFIPILRPILSGYLKICKDIKERRLQLFKNYFVDKRKIMFDRRFESEDDPLFLKLKALNGERSRLAQSFEYNYGDFIPILRPILRGYLKICKDIKERRLQLFKNYFVDKRKIMFNRRFESEDDPLFLKLKALNGERSRLAQSFEYNYGDFIPILRPILRGIMFNRRFESEDDPLFLKLKALNGERSRLAQSFEYNYGDFIPILRPILRGFESEDDPLFLKLKALNGERSRLAQSFEYNYGDFIPILRPFLRGYLKICKDIKEKEVAALQKLLCRREEVS
uniref:Trans-cinnamate 4-monooxygenase n=1 Tax=Fagus sylvatica TaxID=28930 RepID=A0A2N9J4F9_FAGSY